MVDLFDLLVESLGYKEYVKGGEEGEERWENVLELRTVIQQYRDESSSEGLDAFLEGIALVSDVDRYDSNVDAVTLITLHQAKGLEFPVVFMVGMEDGLLPHIRSFDDPGQLEEERRLCYVGVTRAKKLVYMVHAFRRSFINNSGVSIPSRFLSDIPLHLTSSMSQRTGEEMKVAEKEYQPYPFEGSIPPGVLPHQMPAHVEQTLHKDTKGRIGDGPEPAVGQPENSILPARR